MTDADSLAACRERLDAGDAQGTVLELQALLQRSPRNEDVWRLLAEGVAALGDKCLAAETLETAAHALGSPALALAAGQRWEEVGEARKARDLLRHFVLNDAGNLDLYRQLARLDLQDQRWLDANLCLEKALELAPSDVLLFLDYVGTALKNGKAGKTLGWWSRFGNTMSEPELYSNMAQLFLQSGDTKYARMLLEKVPDSRHPDISSNLGRLEYKIGHFSEAADAYLSAANLGKPDADNIVLAMLMSMRDKEAADWLVKQDSTPLTATLRCLLETAPAKRLRASLIDQNLDKTAWLSEMHSLLQERPDMAGRFSALLLLECLQNLLSSSSPPDYEFLKQAFPPEQFVEFAISPNTGINQIIGSIFNAFAIDKHSQAHDTEFSKALFEDYFLPTTLRLLNERQWSKSLVFAAFSYFFVKTEPTPKRFQEWARKLGDTFEPWLASLPPRIGRHCPDLNAPLRVAYITEHFMHDEAPDHVLTGLLAAVQASAQAIPTVMACGNASESIRLQLAEVGVTLIASPRNIATTRPDGVVLCREWLAREMKRSSIDIAIFYGTTPAFCALIAPFLPSAISIYHTVAHYGHTLSALDGFMAATAPVGTRLEQIDGDEWWLYANIAPSKTPTQRQIENAHHEISRFSGKVVIGTIARAMKLTDAFLDVVAAILKARSEAVFVWTDFLPDPQILDNLWARGIKERCYYAGYVDYVTWTEALDIHLDPFPFASGLTMRQTWHRGRAYTMMASRYYGFDGSEKSSALGLTETSVEPLLAMGTEHPARKRAFEIFGRDLELLAVANSTQGYVDWTIRMIDDMDLRRAVGKAAKAYSDAFLTNMSEVAETHLAGIRYFLHKKHHCCPVNRLFFTT